MKLSDLEAVGKLKSERDYLGKLRGFATSPGPIIWRIGGTDLRPDIIERLAPHALAVIDAEIARVDADLAKLGVVVESEESTDA